ncbi:MAG: NAD(P)-dependent oxidoreductase [Candidatus Magasanikbacteria bacterium]|jgi:GDP-L-fucose synthase
MKDKKKIFLTGGGGFVGKNILEQLGDKYEFIAPRSSELDLTNSDKVFSFVQSLRPDLVIHAAKKGGSRKDPNSTDICFKDLQMFFNIVRSRKYFGRMIMFGSGAEYDKRFDIAEVKEDFFETRMPVDQYGFYKYICAQYAARVDFITHLRIFGVFGKYEDFTIRFISNNICRALFGLPISVNQDTFFEYIFVDDFIKILDYFINNPSKEKFYNIGNGSKLSLLDIGNKILKKSGKDIPILLKKTGLNKEYTCNIDRLKNEIPDLSFISIDEAIDKLFLYYSKNIKNIKKEDILFD